MGKLLKGLYTDCQETDQPEGSYRFAKNLVDTSIIGAKENEEGFTDLGTVAPYTKIGMITIENFFVIFSTDNANSEIGKYQNGIYTAIYNNPGLAFSTSAPIEGLYRITTTGQHEIHWIDNNNPPRILNIDDTSGVNSVNDLNVFQDVQNPAMSPYSISDFGGSLQTAAYIPITRYKGIDGSATNWFVHDKVFYINDDPKTSAFQVDDGAPALTASNKAINLTFTGCDTNYDTLVVGYIRIAGQVTTAYVALSRSVSSTVNVTITGSESLSDISLDEILTSNSIYSNAKAITQVNNQLALANLTSVPLPNLQIMANTISVGWVPNIVNVISNTNSHKDTLPQSLMPGEVYAFYLGIELLKGGWVYYHIPGRGPVAGETSPVTTDGLSYLKYQVDDTTDAGGASSNMGYWENTSETYPNNATIYGGLAGQKVRHHRMPTVTKLESVYGSNATLGVTHLYSLNIGVANVNIPSFVQTQIKRWKIFFAKKSPSNSIFEGSDLVHYPVSQVSQPGVYWTTGGNWKIDAGSSGFVGWESMNNVHQDSLLGHCLDHLYAPGEYQPDFAIFPYALRGDFINNVWTGFRGTGGKLSVSGSSRGQVAGVVMDYTSATINKRFVGQFRKLNSYKVLPQNAKDGKFKSAYAESFFTSDITPLASIGGSYFSDFPSFVVRGSGTAAQDNQFNAAIAHSNFGEETVFMMYGKVVSNAHTSFTSQDLVPMEGYAAPSETATGPGTSYFSGGDTFLCYMSHLACGPLNGNQVTTSGAPGTEGVRAWKAYVGYSRRNWNYRNTVAGSVPSSYYGKTDPTTLYSPPLSTPVNLGATGSVVSLISTFNGLNQINYNPDYNASNIFSVGTTYSVDVINATSFPNLIIWSAVQGTESVDVSWRFYPAGNRYTMPKNKGAIINLEGIGNRDLIVHHEGSIYKTITDTSLGASDGSTVTLKSNDFFTIPPEELVSSKTWYGGTQNKFSCLLTKVGYAYIDDSQGKVFLFADQLYEISSNGMRNFFRDNSKGIAADNAFVGNGYTSWYDEKYNRLLFSKKQGGTSFTASYNVNNKTWVSFHDYIPDGVVTIANTNTYSIKNQRLYLHNSGTRGIYYDPTPYPAKLDIVFNPDPYQKKSFASTEWVTEIYDTSGVLQPNETVDYLTFRNVEQCSGRIPVDRLANTYSFYDQNARSLNRSWFFNNFRDIAIQPGFVQNFYTDYALDSSKLDSSMDWYDQRKFIDKYVLTRFEFLNDTGYKFLFLDSLINYRPSAR